MKRALVTTWFLCAVAALGGCPLYSHEDEGCYRDRDCAPGYYCEDRTGDCVSESVTPTCSRPSQCAASQTCNPKGLCVSGDCTFNGCVAGYGCNAESGTWTCVAVSSPGSAGAAGEPAAGAGPMDSEVAGAGGSGGSPAAGASGESGSAGQPAAN
jgi:hypothetical protein